MKGGMKSRYVRWLLRDKYHGVKTPEFSVDKERLNKGEPFDYVIGNSPFLNLTIYLDSHPLIPRTETEWWVEQLLKEISDGDTGVSRSATARGPAIFQQKNTRPPEPVAGFRFLDLCAGSGAIGCAALKMLPNAKVYFGEIDRAHKETILKNIRENKLDESRAHSKIGDLFEPFGDMKFDVIAANPPYIPTDRVLDSSVADYEPALALRSGADGLDLMRRIASELPHHLAQNGVAWIECDTGHAEVARDLFAAAGMTAEIRIDQYNVSRVIVVSFPHD